jgi:hypothetical protein
MRVKTFEILVSYIINIIKLSSHHALGDLEIENEPIGGKCA